MLEYLSPLDFFSYLLSVFLLFTEILQLFIEEMSAQVPPKIIIPSNKPLPALPTENIFREVNKNSKVTSHAPQISLGSNDLSLDSCSLGHIRRILKQSLNNCAVDNDPWEFIILGIVLDIAEIMPKAIETLTLNKKSSSTTPINGTPDEKINESEITKPSAKFVINLKKEDAGKPTDSHFVYNHYDGDPLFKHEEPEGLEPSKDSTKWWIGGTIIIKGHRRYLNGIDKILELLVFVACNLKLEMCLLRDHSVFRVDDKDSHDAEEIKSVLRTSRRSSKSSWFGWLMRHNNLSHISHIKEHSHKINEKSLPKRTSTSSTTGTSDNFGGEEDMAILTTNKFSRAIMQMEKTLLSSSPGVKFPPPHVLMRLKEEEIEINLHNNGDEGFKSFVVKDVQELAGALSSGNSMMNFTEKYRTYATISNSQLSVDFQSGLTYLMTNISSLNGVFNHQSISFSYTRFWSPTLPVPCHNHEIITMDYYNKGKYHVDKCLGDVINCICDKAHEACEEVSCNHPGIEHISTYTHNDGRISFSVEELPDQKLKHLGNDIIMWTQCKLCSSKTPLVQMSQATYFYSFAKYLEILFYNEDFSSKSICPHVELRDTLLRCFRRGDFVVKVKYEHVDLFEMRLPKLQISHDLNQVSTGVEDVGKLFIIDGEDERRLINETRLEITYFYGAVKQHITTLEDYLYETLKNLNNETDANPTKEGDDNETASEKMVSSLKSLDELTQTFRTEEFELYDTLRKTKVTVLNNVRQSLVERIRATKKRLTQWQKEHVDPAYLNNLKIKWVEPEYSSSTNCHVFTGSPIIIREDETSSIIAFTLSSQDYFNELALMRSDIGPKSQSAPITPVAELHVPQASSSFSTLLSSLRNPSSSNLATKKESSDSDGTDGDSFTLVDEYSTKIKRKYVNIKDNGLGDRITHGIESLGSMKAFNISSLSSSKDKKKDPEKESEKVKKFTGLFGMNNGDPEKQRDGENNEKQESDQPEATATNGRSSLNENEFLKVKEEANPTTTPFSEGFSWGRKSSQKYKEKDSPHIKHEAIHGNKRFTCTVYFASQFDSLRRRCGIENLCIDSLSRCSSWQVTGGKSASTFFKTQDDRLVIKQMLSSWRIAEKEGFLKFAPKYFEYMDKPPNTPSVLAKIFGFYTIKIKDLKKNNVFLKMDLLVMEHLFFSKTITWKFDLKGIQERHIKDQTKQDDSTLWDGDWVEGQYKSRLLIHSHSKKLLKEALDNDTRFLCDANIMDYSLLVGVDEKRKELVAGIVDFIGAYTLYKKIENKGKTLGRNAKEVTVLPPDQYKDRFRDSIDQYFLAIPDKWVKLPETDANPPLSIADESLSMKLSSIL